MDEIWNEVHKTNVWGSYPSEHVIRFFARNYYNTQRNEVRVLDFGCGGGAHTWYLAREGFDTYAFDGSIYAIENAKAKLDREGLQAHFAVFDGLNAEYEECFFDVVLDNVCIYANCINDIRMMYKKAYSFLKDHGRILTVNFGKRTFGYDLGIKVEKDTYKEIDEGPFKNRGIVHFFDEDEIRSIMCDTGFKNIQIDKMVYTDRGRQIEQYITQAEKITN